MNKLCVALLALLLLTSCMRADYITQTQHSGKHFTLTSETNYEGRSLKQRRLAIMNWGEELCHDSGYRYAAFEWHYPGRFVVAEVYCLP